MTFHAELQLANPKAQAVGANGEAVAAAFFTKRGWVVLPHSVGTKRGDLRIVDVRTGEYQDIEVKTSRGSVYQFCLFRDGKNGTPKTNCSYADNVLLLCVLPSGRTVKYLIPAADLKGKKLLKIRNLDTTSYNRYRIWED